MPMAHERRLILNMDPPLFQTEEYFHCSSCDNLYETTNAGCPCGAGPPRDTTTVWVWAPVRHVELVDG
jgi:hypothetical protein